MLSGFVEDFIRNLLGSLIRDFLFAIQQIMGDMLIGAFFVERMDGLSGAVLSITALNNALSVLYSILVGLLAAKLIWKGYKVYILWRDGEAETPPSEMILSAVFALVVAMAFPVIYEFAVNFICDMANSVLFAFSLVGFGGINDWGILDIIDDINNANLMFTVLCLVYSIALIVALFQMVFRGAELLLFRLGVPLAAVGLVDSDGGVWKPYCQALFRQFATVLAQYFFMILGMNLIVGGAIIDFLVGIVFVIVSFKTPKIISQFVAPSGGGGNKLYSMAMLARLFAGG